MYDEKIRKRFLRYVNSTLTKTAPNFDFKSIATKGKNLGLINDREADLFVSKSIIPNILLEEKGVIKISPAKFNGNYESCIVDNSIAVEYNSPSGCDISPAALQKFKRTTSRSPEITINKFGRSMHFVKNFLQISWGEDFIYYQAPQNSNSSDYIKNYLDRAEPIHLGNILHAVVEGSGIYTHWMLDTLPRLLYLKTNGYDLNKFDNILLASCDKKFQITILNMLDIDRSKIITRAKNGSFFSASSCAYVTNPRQGFTASRKTYSLVKEFLTSNLSTSQDELPEKIYVSRRKASKRKITNEPELIAFLKKFDFQEVILEDLEISQTLQIFEKAKIIIAPHGAGLSNLVYANENAKIIEIFSAHISIEYWKIANEIGLNYYVFQGNYPLDFTAKTVDIFIPSNQKNSMDIKVDLLRFKDFLEHYDII